MNGIIEKKLSVIKEGALAMLSNVKLNETAQKMLWLEAVHTCKHVRNIMATTLSTKSPFEIFNIEKPKIIGSFSEFHCSVYVTKRENLRSR